MHSAPAHTHTHTPLNIPGYRFLSQCVPLYERGALTPIYFTITSGSYVMYSSMG